MFYDAIWLTNEPQLRNLKYRRTCSAINDILKIFLKKWRFKNNKSKKKIIEVKKINEGKKKLKKNDKKIIRILKDSNKKLLNKKKSTNYATLLELKFWTGACSSS